MDKSNVFRSSKFYMWAGDVLNMTILDETGTPIIVNLASVTTPDAPDAGTPLPPVATNAADIWDTSFSAKWDVSTLATKYYLDVATDSSFASKVAGFDNKDVGNVLTASVTGLSGGTTYYYRVRAYNSVGTSGNSNTTTVFNGGRLIINFDDSLASQYLIGFPTLVSLGIKATFYIVPSWIGTANKMTWAQVQEMYAAGMDIQCHSNAHEHEAAITAAALDVELEAVNTAFTANGLPYPLHHAYPYGEYDAGAITEVRKYRISGRAIATSGLEVTDASDVFSLPAVLTTLQDTANINAFKAYLDTAASNNSTLISYSHECYLHPAGANLSMDGLIEIKNYADTKGIDILTISELITDDTFIHP